MGTNIATCKKQPALGLVCKLTEINGVSKMKFSADAEKATYPGKKAVYRVWAEEGEQSAFDLIALEDEIIQLGEQTFYEGQNKIQHKIIKAERLNNTLNISEFTKTLNYNRSYVQDSIRQLPEDVFKLHNPQKYRVLFTETFFNNLQKTMSNNALKSQ